MSCEHKIEILERVCTECGMIVEQFEYVGWTSHVKYSDARINPLLRDLLSYQVPIIVAKQAVETIRKITLSSQQNVKGRRRRALAFAIIFDKMGGDPDVLRRRMHLPRKACAAAIEIYETSGNLIKWHWSNLLREKLAALELSHLYNLVYDQLTISRSRHCINDQMATCIAQLCALYKIPLDQTKLLAEFDIQKFVYWRLKKRLCPKSYTSYLAIAN